MRSEPKQAQEEGYPTSIPIKKPKASSPNALYLVSSFKQKKVKVLTSQSQVATKFDLPVDQ